MNLRPIGVLTALGALLVSVFSSAPAAAQYAAPYAAPPAVPMEPDGPRFRGGVSLLGSALIVPGVVTLGSVGVQGQLGGQISNNWAVYAIPSLDVLFGKLAGIGIGAGVLAEYTFAELPISVGAGPEAGLFDAIGGSNCTNQAGCSSVSGAGGAFYGARLHFGYHPVISHLGIRRKALTLGVDLRVLTGAFGAVGVSNAGTGVVAVAAHSVAVSPAVSIGYTAF